MKKKKDETVKRALSILMIVTFCFGIFGYQLLFSALQHNIHREINREKKENLGEKDFVTIIVSAENASEIHWIEPEKEFRYRGEMYDVVKTKITRNRKYYYCLWDIKEKQLIANYNQTNQHRKESTKKTKGGMHLQLFCPPLPRDVNLPSTEINHAYLSFHIPDNYLITPSPPPKQG